MAVQKAQAESQHQSKNDETGVERQKERVARFQSHLNLARVPRISVHSVEETRPIMAVREVAHGRSQRFPPGSASSNSTSFSPSSFLGCTVATRERGVNNRADAEPIDGPAAREPAAAGRGANRNRAHRGSAPILVLPCGCR